MTDNNYNCFRVTNPEAWIAHVEINRPDQLNAISPESVTGYNLGFLS